MENKLVKMKSDWVVDYLSVFLVGFVSMATEIVGMRFVSPYFGTSTLVWSIFIAVVLLSMSLGSFVGGKFTDKYNSRKLISIVVSGGIIWLSLILLFGDLYLKYLTSTQLVHEYKSFFGIALLFGVPFFLLSFITPLMMSIYLKSLKVTGSTTGRMQAISSFGNISGVIIPSFVFLNHFGNRLSLFFLIIILSSVLIMQKILYRKKFFNYIYLAFIVVWLMMLFLYKDVGADKQVLLDVDSKYSRIQLVNTNNDTSKIFLKTGYLIRQAGWTDDGELIYQPGLDVLSLISSRIETMNNILVIGGGGYGFPIQVNRDYDVNLDVVEIDKKISEITDETLKHSDIDEVKSYYMDGRVFVENTNNIYDMVFVDAYAGDSMPFHLITREALISYKKLIPDGILLINYLGCFLDCDQAILESIYKTLDSVFDNVGVFSGSIDLGRKHNIYFMASDISIKDLVVENSGMVDATYLIMNKTAQELTDDYFPMRFTYL